MSAAETKGWLERFLPRRQADRANKWVDRSAIRERPILLPVEQLLQCESLEARNRVYEREVVALSEAVARRALDAARVAPCDVTAIVSVSCTGYMLPSFEAHLIERLGLRNCARRVPINALGCSAGVAALGVASELLRGSSHGTILVADVELCSLLLQAHDPSPADLLGSVLFGDAAAAAVLSVGDRLDCSGPALEVLSSRSTFWREADIGLGMEMTNRGPRLVLSPRLPALIRQRLRESVAGFLAETGLTLEDIQFFAIHPGGPKILDAVSAALALPDRAVRASWNVWERYGNLSSATIFLILEELCRSAPPAASDLGLVFAPGPGPCCEFLLVRYREGEREPAEVGGAVHPARTLSVGSTAP